MNKNIVILPTYAALWHMLTLTLQYINEKHIMEEGYSPEQIKGRSNVEGFAMVSHETMYRWIWEDKCKKGTL